jgi:hypothetical protein
MRDGMVAIQINPNSEFGLVLVLVLDESRFLQRKEPDCPQIFCPVILIVNLAQQFEDDDEHEDEFSISEFRINHCVGSLCRSQISKDL